VLTEKEVVERALQALDELVAKPTAEKVPNGPQRLQPESETIPPVECWPESLADLAQERAAQTGDAEAARRETWVSWEEWKAQELNRIFDEYGNHGPGRKPAAIKPESVRDGLNHEIRRRGPKQ
jgi:hypothetical protein